MKIAVIVSNFIKLPPDGKSIPQGYSAAPEKVAYVIMEAMVKRGHDVTLFASGDSKTSAKLKSIIKPCLSLNKRFKEWPTFLFEMAHVSFAFRTIDKENFDIIHNHLWPSSFFAPFVKTPQILTLHSTLNIAKESLLYIPKNLSPYLISISNAQRKNIPNLNYFKTIYHGIDIKQFTFNSSPKDYFLICNRIVPDKGTHVAVQACKKLKKKLIIIGDYPRDNKGCVDYFKKEVKPFIDQKKIIWEKRWLTQKELKPYYQNAKAFLMPIQWEEPFGLVMAEAMACGTPVIAFNRGSVPEVVEDGKTGFVVKPFNNKKPNLQGFMDAIEKADQIKRENCRKWVENNFTFEKMIDEYEKVYYSLSKRK